MQKALQKTLKDTMLYNNIPAFIYEINYPNFITTCNIEAGIQINNYYFEAAKKLEQYCRTVLYNQAVETVRYIQDDRLFNSYKLNTDYKITYNSCCITSLYMDTVIYLGGAHEETKRVSHTWDFNTGRQIRLNEIYSMTCDASERMYKTIEQQIAGRLKITPGSYFDDYKTRLRNMYRPVNYYLQPGYIVIYYQQYDISPYFTGLPEFYLPYPS